MATAEKAREPLRWEKKFPWLGTDPVSVEPVVSQDYYDGEIEKVFKKTWLMVARIEEVPKPRSYKLKKLEFANTSVILIHGKDGEIRAFHNTCPHRGNTVIANFDDKDELSGSATVLSCHFHSWSFNDKGQLLGVPEEHKFSCLDRENAGLTPINCDVWEGFIFINLDENPRQTLQEFMGDFGDFFSGFPYAELSNEYKWYAHMNTSWTVGMDAFGEAYHVATIHAHAKSTFPNIVTSDLGEVHLYDEHRRTSVINLPEDQRGKFPPMFDLAMSKISEGSLAQEAGQERSAEHRLPKHMLEDGEDLVFHLGVIFPNTLIHVADGTWFSHQFWPTGKGTCLWEGRYYMTHPNSHTERWAQEYLGKMQRNTWLEDTATMEDTYHSLLSGAKKHMYLQDDEVLIRHHYHVLDKYVKT